MNNARQPLRALLADLAPLPEFIGLWILNSAAVLARDVPAMVKAIFSTRPEAILNAIVDLAGTVIRIQLQAIVTVAALVLNAFASLVNNLFSLSEERQLNTQEREYLYRIFANSIDYSVIRIQSQGIKERIGISPQAVCNDIFLRQKWGGRIFNEDGTLTSAGLKLLGHEVGHVWQFQTGGAAYIGDALLTHALIFIGKKMNLSLTDGYDLCAGIKNGHAFETCNVEQQGVLAELIGATCHSGKELNRVSFNHASGYDLTDAEFNMVLNGHKALQRSSFRTCLHCV